jgi:hypothetical protein
LQRAIKIASDSALRESDHHIRRNELWEVDQQPRPADIAQQCVWDLANLVVVDQALEEMDDGGHGKSLPVCHE